jgi:hypothetical protein
MKTLKSFPGAAMWACLFLMAAALLLTATPAKAATWGTTNAEFFAFFGFTEDWTVLEVGTNDVNVSNQSIVGGNFGIAGSNSLTVSNQSTLDHLFLNSSTNPKVTIRNGSTVHSTTTTNLDRDVTATNNAATYFTGQPNSAPSTWTSSNASLSSHLTLGPTNGYLNLNNQNLTLTATSTIPVVFNISTFSLSSSVLTLSGNADAEFVFNIYGGTMNLQNASTVKLSGGLTTADVVYNYVGSGGHGVTLSNQSTLRGIVLASQQKVNISNQSQVIGAVISNGLTVANQSSLPAIESGD